MNDLRLMLFIARSFWHPSERGIRTESLHPESRWKARSFGHGAAWPDLRSTGLKRYFIQEAAIMLDRHDGCRLFRQVATSVHEHVHGRLDRIRILFDREVAGARQLFDSRIRQDGAPTRQEIRREQLVLHSPHDGSGFGFEYLMPRPQALLPSTRTHQAFGHPIRSEALLRVVERMLVLVERSEEHTSELQSQFHIVCR